MSDESNPHDSDYWSKSMLRNADVVIGSPLGEIEIVKYDEAWSREYLHEKHAILGVLRDDVVSIELVGSTAIEGMEAKPTIDIVAGMKTLLQLNAYLECLANIGYTFRPNHPVPGRLHFAKITNGLRTHNLSLTEYLSSFWHDHVVFRDFLNENPNVAAEYLNLKRELATNHPNDPTSYTDGKDEFIKPTLENVRLGRNK